MTNKTNGTATHLHHVHALRTELRAAFQERDQVIDALLCAVLAGEHCVMLGPPGTGKSAIARALCGSITDATYFEWLLSRYTEPNELFGSIDLPKWSAGGVYERRMDGMLPTAHIAFLDEVFKANSSILNALLALINERVFHDGGLARTVPLITMVAASNELPEGPELEALYDRFLVRIQVDYVKDENAFEAIVTGPEPSVPPLLSFATLAGAQAAAMAVPLGNDIVESMFTLRNALATEGIVVSDRRWKKLVKLLRAHAYLLGDTQVDLLHFEVLKHGLWRDPREMAKVNSTVTKLSSPILMEAMETFDAIMEQVQAIPPQGSIRDSGAAAVGSEIKKAIKRMEQLRAGVSIPVASRITPMIDELKGKHAQIVSRITAELGL